MAKKKDVNQALDLLRNQMGDNNVADGTRQGAAKAILAYYRESINPMADKAQGKGVAKAQSEDAAVQAAERIRRVR